ncbi:MAG: hypothetical protein ABH969_10080 [Pseudomonadota bacterium]
MADRKKNAGRVFREQGDAIEGDHIRIYCRKPSSWKGKVRLSDSHHYFMADARKNAQAIILSGYTNLQK